MNNSNCPNCGSDFYRNVTTKRNNCFGLCDPCRTRNRNDKRKINEVNKKSVVRENMWC